MSKRDEAFILFDQGKTPSDPELETLNLKRKTLKNYYKAWKESSQGGEGEPPVAPEVGIAPPAGVPVQSLQRGQKFELDGELFQVHSVEPGFIVASKLEWAPSGDCMIERWQRPVILDTVVIPKD